MCGDLGGGSVRREFVDFIRVSQDTVTVTVLVNMFTAFNYTEFADCTDPLGVSFLHKNGLV